jgi:hypothetical protein
MRRRVLKIGLAEAAAVRVTADEEVNARVSWSDWFNDDTNEQASIKITNNDDDSWKYEQLRSNDSDKSDHQHTWINFDSDGKPTSGGSTPGKR